MKKQLLFIMITSSAGIFASLPSATQSSLEQSTKKINAFNVETDNLYIKACDMEIYNDGTVQYKINKTFSVYVSKDEDTITIKDTAQPLKEDLANKCYSIKKIVYVNASTYKLSKTRSTDKCLVFFKKQK